MIGIVLIGHAHIASEMILAVEHVLGEQPLLKALDAPDSDQPEQLRDELVSLIRQCDTGHGVLLMADMFGGTPCNVAMSCLNECHVEILSGFNLPALIKAVSLRRTMHSLPELAAKVVLSGQQYICRASDFIAGESGNSTPSGRGHGHG